MKIFACDVCEQLLFFESVRCTRCGAALSYLPDRAIVSRVEETDRGSFRALGPAGGGAYRACRNGTEHAACNWAIPAHDPDEYCRACRLNQIIPNLSDPRAAAAWHRLETAKRRLLYTLFDLGLPVESKAESPDRGLAFAFLADDPSGAPAGKVFTGHNDGVITINIAEADDASREKMRVEMGEAYRTLLGHFRHEVGHYYWQRLVAGGPHEDGFRARFGDERADYAAAQRRHYDEGPPPDWRERFVSAYASMHPWEDWAETWAHYLHMHDTLETARAYGLALKPEAETSSRRSPTVKLREVDLSAFASILSGWVPVTVALNSLNRSMGHSDWYPFVLTAEAIEKLRFVHDVIAARTSRAG